MSDGGGSLQFRVFLDNARNGELKDINGGYLKIVNSSSAGAEIEISTNGNIDGNYYLLKRTGFIEDNAGFSRIHLRHSAQAGEWVDIMITADRQTYDVHTFDQFNISGIDEEVKVINKPGDVLETKDSTTRTRVKNIVDMLQNAVDQRAPLTDLSNAQYAEALGTTVTVLDASAGDNPNGVIIHSARTETSSGGDGEVRAGGNIISRARSGSGSASTDRAVNEKIAAGIDLVISGDGADVWYTEL